MRPNVLSARKSFIYIKYMKDQLILSAVLVPAFSQLKDLNPKLKECRKMLSLFYSLACVSMSKIESDKQGNKALTSEKWRITDSNR